MDFLLTKAKNFRAYLKDLNDSSEALVLLEQYNEAELVGLVKRYLLPLFALGQLSQATTKVMEAFPRADALKVERYLCCFCEVVVDKLL